MKTILIVAAIAFLAYIIYLKMLNTEKIERGLKAKAVYAYKSKGNLMTPSESEFYKKLIEVAGDRYYIFPQVHLSAILDEKIKKQDWKAAFGHINGKSVDYVLCDKITLKPTYAVELDDASHDSAARQLRDTEVERIFMAANLPLVRFSNYRSLSNDAISNRFLEAHNLADVN